MVVSCLFSCLLSLLSASCGILPERTERIHSRIEQIQRMPGYEFVYRDVVYVGEERTIFGVKTMEKETLFSVRISVTAGIDLEDGIEIERTGFRGIKVILPAPEILSVDADEASIHQYFARERGEAIGRLEYYDEIHQAKEGIIEDAVRRGILNKSTSNIEAFLTSFLSTAGFEHIEIRFRGQSKDAPALEPDTDPDTGTDEAHSDTKNPAHSNEVQV